VDKRKQRNKIRRLSDLKSHQQYGFIQNKLKTKRLAEKRVFIFFFKNLFC